MERHARATRNLGRLHGGSEDFGKIVEGRLLADDHATRHEILRGGLMREVLKDVRFPRAEATRDEHPGYLSTFLDTLVHRFQLFSETLLDFRLLTAEDPNGILVGDSISQRLDCAPIDRSIHGMLFDHDGAPGDSRTNAAIGFTRSLSRTSSKTRNFKAS
jgi:hypothetical protein